MKEPVMGTNDAQVVNWIDGRRAAEITGLAVGTLPSMARRGRIVSRKREASNLRGFEYEYDEADCRAKVGTFRLIPGARGKRKAKARPMVARMPGEVLPVERQDLLNRGLPGSLVEELVLAAVAEGITVDAYMRAALDARLMESRRQFNKGRPFRCVRNEPLPATQKSTPAVSLTREDLDRALEKVTMAMAALPAMVERLVDQKLDELTRPPSGKP